MPIGLDFHSVANSPIWDEWPASPKTQESDLEKIIHRARPNRERQLRVHADFHFNQPAHDHPWDRRADIHRSSVETRTFSLRRSSSADASSGGKRRAMPSSSAPTATGSTATAPGNPFALGCIVIVKRSALDPLYEGLPVVIVEDWDEITTDNLHLWHEQHRDAFDRPRFRRN